MRLLDSLYRPTSIKIFLRFDYMLLKVYSIWALLSFLFLGNNLLMGQSLKRKFDHITSEQGLPGNSIRSIYQDHIGFIWVGTSAGLSKFDGYDFQTFNDKNSNLLGKAITAIFEDSDKNLWVGTSKGFGKFNRKTHFFENFVIDSTAKKNRQNRFITTQIYEDKYNTLWIGTEKGLYQFDRNLNRVNSNWVVSDSIKNIIDRSYISTINMDSKGRLWIGTREKGIFLFHNNNQSKSIQVLNHINQNNDLLEYSKKEEILQILEDNKGNNWVLTDGNLFKLNEVQNSFEFHKINIPMIRPFEETVKMNTMVVDKFNNLWLGHLNGLYFLQEGKKTLQNVEILTNNGINHHNYLRPYLIDNSGVLWIGSLNGIYKDDLWRNKFEVFRPDQKSVNTRKQNMTWSIFMDSNEQIWVGTQFGLNKLVWSIKEKNYYYEYVPNNLVLSGNQESNRVTGILEYDKEHLLIISKNRLFKVNKLTLKFKELKIKLINEFELPSNESPRPYTLAFDRMGYLWIGTQIGLVRYDVKQNISKGYTLYGGTDLKANNRIKVIHIDKFNRLWIGTQNGVNLFSPKKESNEYFKLGEEVSKSFVYSINSSNGKSIWFGAYGTGLYHLIPKAGDLNFDQGFKLEEYHRQDGLASEYIFAIVADNYDNLWISTNNGLSRFNQKSKKFKNYSTEDGLQSNEFNSGAFHKAYDGSILFGGISGINRFYPEKFRLDNKSSPLVITSFKTIESQTNLVNQTSMDKTITLEYDENHISLEFALLDYRNSNLIEYAYKLDGIDDDWVYSGKNRSITYNSLDPGTYFFKLKGKNSREVWSQSEDTLIITIKPPPWATKWFYILMTFIMISTISFIILRIRIKQVRLIASKEYFERKHQEKVAIIKEIHHRVKNNLQVVNSLLKFQSREIEDEDILNKFKEAQSRVLSMALLHEKLYRTDDLQHIDVKEHIQLLIEDLVKNYTVGKKIKVRLNVDDVKFGPATLVPLGLIINEIITNSLKYAFIDRAQGEITLTLQANKSGSVEMILGDNGIGYQEEKKIKSKGIGTKLVASFVRQLNGKIELLNRPGTVFKLSFQVKLD